MKDYLRGNLTATIKVYSDLAENDMIPARYLFRSYSQMPVWEQRALDECRGNVLDIGAGAGSHAIHLQNAGFAVTGLDISPGAIEIMQQRGLLRTLHENVWNLKDQSYDTLLLIMNGIGVVGDLKGLNQFLNYARSLLNPGGQILLDSSDISYLFEDEQDSMPPNEIYYGIISYQMSYQKALGESFQWLYIDSLRLERHARMLGYRCEVICEGNHYEYLARLTVNDAETKP